MMAENTREDIAKVLLSKSRRATYLRVFAVLALCVMAGVAFALHQNGIAMVHKERVLTCPVTQTVAHEHNEDCYDTDGSLVCPLPELSLHTHTDGCYTEIRELTCGQEESEGHVHTDDCYTVTQELTCDQEEVTEEHVHGPGCFTVMEVPDDMPRQTFTGELRDQDDKVILLVEVEAPEGALPANSTMEVKAIDADELKSVADEAVAQRTEGGKVSDIQAVDITFRNEVGEEIEPETDVTVRFVSDFIAQNENAYIVHMDDDGKGDIVDSLTDEQLAERNQQASEDELYIDTSKFSPYMLVAVSFRKTLVASDGKSYTITVDCPAEAAVPQDAELQVTEVAEGTDDYEGYLVQVGDALADDVSYARFFDIKIVVDGEVFQPKDTVSVTVELDTETDKLGDEVKAVQIGDGQVGVIPAQVEPEAVSFDADELPVYGIVGTQVLTGHVMTAGGESFTIEVTCGPEAGIPEGASLQATEILEGTQEYEDYLSRSNDALVAESRSGESEAADGSEPADGEGSGLLEESEDGITFARFFDIKIVKDDKVIEPKVPVQVSIHYDDAIELEEGEQIKAVHFADAGTEVIDVSVERTADGITDIQYMQDSFSVTGTVVRYLSEGWPDNGDYVIIVKPFNENHYYAVRNDGEITCVQYNESTGKVTFTDLVSLDEADNYVWNISSSSSIGWKYVKSGTSYLDPRQESGITTSKESVATYKGLLYKSYYQAGWPMGHYVYDYLMVDETGLKIKGQGSHNDGNRAIVMLAKDFEVDEVPEPTPDPNSDYDLGAPVVSKSLNPNDDGTYQLALSVTGKSHAMENHTKADILVIFDTSGSMDSSRMSTAKSALNGLADQLFANNTAEHPDTVRMKLLTFSNVVGSKSKGNLPENYYGDFAWVTGSVSGSTVNTGATSFKADINSLSNEGNGGTNWEDALTTAASIEMRSDAARYVIFVSDGNPTFRNTAGTYKNFTNDFNQEYNGIYSVYGTGSEGDTTVKRCYEHARDDAQALVDAGVNFYTIAVFGDVNRMSRLTAYAYSGDDSGTYPDGRYQNASNRQALNAAFESIVSDIRADFKYTKVEINDGITNLTARALVEGVPNNYQYAITYVDAADNEKKSVSVTKNADGTVSIPSVTYTFLDTEGSEKTVTTEAVTLKGASYDGQTVNWKLDRSNGSNYKLESGWTYEVSFTVWPTQRAYDLVADLANGTQRYSQLSADDKAAIDQASLTLKTNTSASVSYRQIKSKNGVDEAPSAAKTVDIPNPPGVPLIGSDLRIVKRWNDILDPTQLLDLLTSKLRPDGTVDYSVRLDVTQDKGTSRRKSVVTADYPDGFLFQPQVVVEDGEVVSAEWPTIDIAVAPGVMVSEAEAHRLGLDTATDAQGHAKYETIEFDGVTYYILEAGHRYEITEASVDYHFEMMSDVDHLMIVDGILKNLIQDDDGNILSMSDNSENLTELGATNSIKGGVNLTKVVKDTQGRTVTPTEDVFTVRCQLLDEDGNPYTRDSETVTNESDGIVYRVYADSDDDLATVYPGKVDAGKGRTKKIGVLNSNRFEVKLKAGWTVRFINVPSGTTYNFTEVSIPEGYELLASETTGTSGTAEVNVAKECTVTNTMKNRKVTLLKVQMGTEGFEHPVVLDGVKFVLKRQSGDGTQYLSRTGNESTWVSDKAQATEFVTDAHGTADLGSLPLDTYYLEETLPKAGYMLPAGDVVITVDADGVRYQAYDSAAPQEAVGGQVVVPNSTGQELPHTGGAGTATLYAIGIMLVAFVSAWFTRRLIFSATRGTM